MSISTDIIGIGAGVFGPIRDSVLIKRYRNIAGIFPDVVIEEHHRDELEITHHPVERGAPISDHAFKKPVELTIRCGWSDSSSEFPFIGTKSDVIDFYNKLLALQGPDTSRPGKQAPSAIEPFSIITGKRAYQNMLLESLSTVTTRETENSLIVEARFREVIIVSTQAKSNLPPVKDQAFPQKTADPINTGTKQPSLSNPSVLDGTITLPWPGPTK